MTMEQVSISRAFDGEQEVYKHASAATGTEMTFSIHVPPHDPRAKLPVVAPSQVPWGQKALTGYLGEDPADWRKHDAAALIEDGARDPALLIDQGASDMFLEQELRPDLLSAACKATNIPLSLRLHERYDHSYYFISTFMADHLRWHAARLVKE